MITIVVVTITITIIITIIVTSASQASFDFYSKARRLQAGQQGLGCTPQKTADRGPRSIDRQSNIASST